MKSDSRHVYTKGTIYSAAGLGVQTAGALTLYLLSSFFNSILASFAFWTACAGLPVWLHLIIVCLLKSKDSPRNSHPIAKTHAGSMIHDLKLSRFYWKYCVWLFEISVLALLVRGAVPLFLPLNDVVGIAAERALPVIALEAVAGLVLIIAAVYFTQIAGEPTLKSLRAGVHYLALAAFLFVLLCLCAWLDYISFVNVSPFAVYVIASVNALFATEIIFSILIKIYRPQKAGECPRPAFYSYLGESLLSPANAVLIMKGMLHDLFGFDISKTSVFAYIRQMIIPFVGLSVPVLMLLSCVIIVEQSEQAVALTFGNVSPETLGPGIHFRYPWPVGSVRTFNVKQIRRVHAGSHRSKESGGKIYKERVPILWTNRHGLFNEELLIISAPKELYSDARKSGGRFNRTENRAPSISLIGADIVVEYVISRLHDYIAVSCAPDLMLKKYAEAEVSRMIYAYDIDDMFCEKRLALSDLLVTRMQEHCNRHKLGIDIIHTGVTAVHPPYEVAEAFEQTIAARQERETRIQQARQEAIQIQVETAGSKDNFKKLAALIDKAEEEKQQISTDGETILLNCGGDVSQLVMDAYAYRWSREYEERGKTERFKQEQALYRNASKNYRYERFLSILETGLEDRRKMMVIGDRNDMLLRMTLPGGQARRMLDQDDFE
ncbi:MAG: hypothetical protein GF401_17605 [Chitinivibrionales bacterium]|nr:hypothetical protein [Chitinivibrionales bacterium]